MSESKVVPVEILKRLLFYAENVRCNDIAGNIPIFGDIDAIKDLLAAAPEQPQADFAAWFARAYPRGEKYGLMKQLEAAFEAGACSVADLPTLSADELEAMRKHVQSAAQLPPEPKRWCFVGYIARYEGGVFQESIEHSVYRSDSSELVVLWTDYDALRKAAEKLRVDLAASNYWRKYHAKRADKAEAHVNGLEAQLAEADKELPSAPTVEQSFDYRQLRAFTIALQCRVVSQQSSLFMIRQQQKEDYARAEKAEAQLAEAKRDAERLRESIKLYNNLVLARREE